MQMASNMNIMQLLQMVQNNPNPPAFIMEMLKSQSGGNPLFANILAMAQNGNRAGIEQVARNIYKEKGLDFDKEFNSLKQMLGVK
jgi:hypothetical protein